MKKSEVETTGLKQNSTLDSLNFTKIVDATEKRYYN